MSALWISPVVTVTVWHSAMVSTLMLLSQDQDPHCVLFADNEVYAWGNNTMGQCGQGHTQSPITRPKKVMGLEGVAIHQISAGTSHSFAWTALPKDRLAVDSCSPKLYNNNHTAAI